MQGRRRGAWGCAGRGALRRTTRRHASPAATASSRSAAVAAHACPAPPPAVRHPLSEAAAVSRGAQVLLGVAVEHRAFVLDFKVPPSACPNAGAEPHVAHRVARETPHTDTPTSIADGPQILPGTFRGRFQLLNRQNAARMSFFGSAPLPFSSLSLHGRALSSGVDSPRTP